VLHCLSIASSFGLPALFFQGDRAGFVQAAVPMLEKWRNGQPCSVPIQPIPPEPPMRMFKDDAERTNYCNVAAGHRVTVDIPIAGGNEFANPGDKFTRSGQQVNQALDKWNTVQVPNSVPSVTVILDVVRDALKGLPDSEMAPSLAYEVPLRQ
jgi:hypothetical protein